MHVHVHVAPACGGQCAGFEHAWVTALRSSRSSGSGSTALVHSTREVRSSSSKGGLGDAWASGRVRVRVRVRVGVRVRVRVGVRVRVRLGLG